ncbi:calcium/sodium antiporter [Marinomonas agarivorans]|nr:calcium/sodium antiporter [Marinomonas agarivorans]
MLISFAALIIGLVILVISSDKFITHSALIAKKLAISPIVIGFTLVALGTSAPEMVVSAIAALDQSPEIAIGNVFGSNIANIGLVFGATLFISAIPVKQGLAFKEVPILLGVTVLAGLLIIDGNLTLIDGVVLIVAFIVALYLLLRSSKNLEDELTQDLPDGDTNTLVSSVIVLVGLTALIGSSKLLVWGATGIATTLGVSELIIGLTIVAIGTSLPELAASVTSAVKGHHDIAVGNILGSNLFNLATVLPFPAIIAPSLLSDDVLSRDYWWMLGTTVALIGLILFFRKQQSSSIPKWCGYPLLGSYFIYLAYLYVNTLTL